METKKKWGINCTIAEKEGRIPNDYNTVDKKYVQFIHILEKVPIFKDLTVEQFVKILSLCNKRITEKNTIICRSGDESHEMYILLKGTLKIVTAEGTEISKIPALGIVGEMGIFTGEKRSATVIADHEAIILAIQKAELIELFNEDSNLAMTILTNVIRDLSNKLKTNNIIMSELRHIVMTGEFTKILEKVLDVEND